MRWHLVALGRTSSNLTAQIDENWLLRRVQRVRLITVTLNQDRSRRATVVSLGYGEGQLRRSACRVFMSDSTLSENFEREESLQNSVGCGQSRRSA